MSEITQHPKNCNKRSKPFVLYQPTSKLLLMPSIIPNWFFKTIVCNTLALSYIPISRADYCSQIHNSYR